MSGNSFTPSVKVIEQEGVVRWRAAQISPNVNANITLLKVDVSRWPKISHIGNKLELGTMTCSVNPALES